MESKPEEPRGGGKGGGRALGGRPYLVAPRDSPDLALRPIYSHIFQNPPGEPRNHFSTAATFYTHEIPSWGLLWQSAGGGFNHGGLLHQPYCPSDEA